MKKASLSIILLLFTVLLPAQTAFLPDAYGTVSDPAFLKLIKDRNYQLVGGFVTVSKKPLLQYAKVMKYNQWGFIDIYGNEVIAPRFDLADDFKDGLLRVVINESVYTGVINRCYAESYIATRCFYINTKGEAVTQRYDIAYPFERDVAVVSKQGKWGLIDRSGKEVVATQYDQIIVNEQGYFAKTEKKWALLSHLGIPLTPFIYDEFRIINGFLLACTNRTFILLDPKTAKPLNSTVYDFIHPEGQNWPDFIPVKNGKALVVKESAKYFLVNRKGKHISAPYEWIAPRTKNYFVVTKGNKYGLLDINGKLVFDIIYDYVGPTEDETVFYTKIGDTVTYFDRRYRKIPIAGNLNVGPFTTGMAAVWDKGKMGFINARGKIVVPMAYTNYLGWFQNDGQVIVINDHKYGVIDRKGKVLLQDTYPNLFYGAPHDYTFMEGDKVGIIRDDRSIVVAPTDQRIEYKGYGYYEVSIDDKYGIMEADGRLSVPTLYDKINDYREGLIQVEFDGLAGYIDRNGAVVIPLKYEELGSFKNGLSQVSYNRRIWYVDRYGHECGTELEGMDIEYYF